MRKLTRSHQLLSEEELLKKLVACEDFILIDEVDEFIRCSTRVTSIPWEKKDVVLIDEDGRLVRVVAMFRLGDYVYSVLAYYDVSEDGVVYSGLDVDLSSVDEVVRVVGSV